MRTLLILLSLAWLMFYSRAFPQISAAPPLVVNPHVSTDKSVDCSSLDRILGSLVKEGMSDEQKVLALFNWIRRTHYHGDGPESIAYDFGTSLLSMGNGSCLRQTTPLALLLSRLGYESESWVHDGHHMLQVKYGGGWHCFDPHMNFYVHDRANPPQIAGIDQLRADSTLAYDAFAEGRAAPGYLLCGDSPGYFTGRGEWVKEAGWPKMTVREPFGQISLRRGEKLVFTWMPGECYYREAWNFDCGPYHTCGLRDTLDSVNWPLYEPYQAKVNNVPSYRHWAAGKLVYNLDLFSDHYRDGVVRQVNVLRGCPCYGMLPFDLSQPAELVFRVNCPYIITGGGVKLKRYEIGGIFAVEVSTDEKKGWQPVELTAADEVFSARFDSLVNGSFNGYLLKVIFKNNAQLESIEMTADFQLNPYALPYLVPGENTVKAEAEQFNSPLKVEWEYAEGPGWNSPKNAVHTFREPGQFKVQVGGQKYPRCLSLGLSVLP